MSKEQNPIEAVKILRNDYDKCANQLTTTQARLAEAISLLDEFSHRSLFGNSQLSSDGHLGICSVRGVKPEKCRVCGTTIRTLNFLYSTEPPAILKELEEAKDQVNHYRAHYEATLANCNEVITRAESAEAKLVEAEKDKARLDWLEKQNGQNWVAREPVTNRGFRLHNDERSIHKNAREAIDAAMKQTT